MPSNVENWFDCEVCGTKTRFFHLNAKICRACSSYYRRALTENLRYKCKFVGRCDLTKPEAKCRACRFSQCAAAGARLTVDVQLEPAVTQQPTSSVNGHVTERSKLDELIKGYDLFLLAQRSLFVMRHPEVGMGNDEMIRPKKKLLSSMDIECIPLVLKFFNEHFGPFKKLAKTQKIAIVTEVFDGFSTYNKIWLTLKHFPDINDPRLAHANGYYAIFNGNSKSEQYWFFEDYVVPDKIDEYVKIFAPIIQKVLKIITKAKFLRLRQVDILGMVFMSLFNHVEEANLLTDEMIQYRDELIKEWMNSIREAYGTDEMMPRFTQLMMFYYQCDDLVTEINNLKTVVHVYLLKDSENDWCDIESHIKKLDLGADDTHQS